MIASARYTWILLRRPALLWSGIGAVAAFGIAVTVATFFTASRPGGSRLGPIPLTIETMGAVGVPADLVGRILMITGAVTLAVAAAHVGGVFSTGLVRTIFVRQPHRTTWLLGTWLTLCGLTVALTLIGSITVLATATALASAYGVDTAAWFTPEGLSLAAIRTLGVAAALIGFTTAGMLLAVLTRSAIVAIGIGLGYGLFEGLLSATLGDAGRFLPAQTLAVVSRGTADPWFFFATLIAAALIGACLTVAAVTLHRRDITQ
ncbi:ABC-type transport system involved in multi-copper enzyme maturation permease subunit [Microbacterium sp. AK009]|uniref:hypothetical protein n=1 Tax=Microbacterium sp. AK009 TaxID=2723068 RepID=UPI0015CAB4B0|nr:hypothetical protein [Microbacterium sp. AK009]NYF18049.1 ABC-type transport system involved in multi-copper enzyme maturation permease subunit [Microbacterium sp. AK009]